MDTSSTLASNHLNLFDEYDGQPPLDYCYRPGLPQQQQHRPASPPSPAPLLLSPKQSAAEAAAAAPAVRKRGRPQALMGVLRISALLLLSHCIISSTLHEAYALPIVTTLRAQGPRGVGARMFAQGSISEQPLRHHRYVSLVGGAQPRLLKKSQNPQWEDLGWAWGKRSDPKQAAAAQWDDLGWAWGKRSESSHVAGGKGSGTEWEDLGWAWGKRSSGPAERLSLKHNQQQMSPTQFRAIQSLSKKNPDWHDLGWAWGR